MGGNDSVLKQICDCKSSAHAPKGKFPLKFIISAMNVVLILRLRNEAFKKLLEKGLFSDTACLK